MRSTKADSRGFTLIASLMLMLIMSGVAVGLLMMVSTEGKVGGQDVQNNLAFHAAEGGIEHMTSDLANMFQNIESPTPAQIAGLSADAPANTAVMNYPLYSLTAATKADGTLASSWGQIATGTYQGLYAQLLPVNLQVTASTSILGGGTVGDEVNMSRTVEVALIPVFQFGVFSDSDLGFFSSPNLNFAGRVHTNGDLYLGVANGFTLRFHDKLSAWGNVIRQVLPNGLAANAFNDSGVVLIPQSTGGCDLPAQLACQAIAATEGSVIGAGGNPPASGPTVGPPSWRTISLNTAPWYNGFITDGNYGVGGLGTGATNLTLPFVNGTTGATTGPQPFEIVRRPPPGESPTGALGASRLYNEAEIRVLLSDSPDELPCGNPSGPPVPGCGSGDSQNVRLANGQFAAGPNYLNGVQTSFVKIAGMPNLAAGDNYTTYFATASSLMPNRNTPGVPANPPSMLPDWLYAPVAPTIPTLWDANAPVLRTGVLAGKFTDLTVAPLNVNINLCNTVTGVCPPYPWFNTPPTGGAGFPLANAAAPTETAWNLLDGYLRVEYRDVNGNYHPITQEWLKLGFARGVTPPVVAGTNPVNPNAILILQQPADRNADLNPDSAGVAPSCVKSGASYTCTVATLPEVVKDATTGSPWYGDSLAANPSFSMYNWYPINFYDPREGESRDIQQANNSCTPNGIMNAVELDVGNLKRWLAGQTGVSGPLVDFLAQNGYILYFSDRRGMLPNPNGTQVPGTVNTKTGDSGLEDDINRAIAAGNPDGVLDPNPPGKANSPEDVNLNGFLDNFGAANIGLGLGYGALAPYSLGNSVNRQIIFAAPAPNPYLTATRLPACIVGQRSWISGARHALKLVDGTLGNLPLRPDNGQGGFTVGSENPLYIFGNYNTNAGDAIWNVPPGADPPLMAAAGVVADAVTVLSNTWVDVNSLNNVWPTNPYTGGNSVGFNVPAPARVATTTYYRVAVAGGKNMNFPFPGWETAADYGFGTDGGVHNFLRFVEDWSGVALNYEGSLVSLYYATYNTGAFKCCNYSVYRPPARNYIFDPDFTVPAKLPPGTPMFRDIDNLSYRQSFTPHTGNF